LTGGLFDIIKILRGNISRQSQTLREDGTESGGAYKGDGRAAEEDTQAVRPLFVLRGKADTWDMAFNRKFDRGYKVLCLGL
jgi:hypothetical protein